MKAPSVHLNGTSGDVLLEQYRDAAHAIVLAIGALENAAPNARDYYVQDLSTAFDQAVREHRDRVEQLRAVLADLTVIGDSIDSQIETRKQAKEWRTR